MLTIFEEHDIIRMYQVNMKTYFIMQESSVELSEITRKISKECPNTKCSGQKDFSYRIAI